MSQGNLSLHHDLHVDALVYPQLTNESLLSIGELCDKGCIALFDKSHLHIFRNDCHLLTGHCNLNDGLWDVPFKTHGIDKINYIVTKDKNKMELAQYLHACAFSPVNSTFQECIKKGIFFVLARDQ